MSYKTILVCLNTENNTQHLLECAVNIAKQAGAHLVGAYQMPKVFLYPSGGFTISGEVVQAFSEHQEEKVQKAKQVFQKAVAEESFTSEWRKVEAGNTNSFTGLASIAHSADLVILSQASAETDAGISRQIVQDLMSNSGRPVLVIPSHGTFPHIGTNPLIGWDGKREAARAVHDAIPLIQKSGKARILSISANEHQADYQSASVKDLSSSLKRHGIEAEVTDWMNAHLAVGDILLNEAANHGCDLIVAGAYGHSRIYDIVVGAATSSLLEHMTVPVLFSH